MIRISIVEDEKVCSAVLAEHIGEFAKDSGRSVEVKIYDKPVAFLSNYHSDTDILFVDIKMPGMSGMELAEKLRELDKELIIIFTTNFEQYAIDGYSVTAAGFLLKPVDYPHFLKAMNRAVAVYDARTGKSINVKSDGAFYKIPVKDITFVEILGRQIIIHLANGDTITTKGTLTALQEQLKPLGFVRCEHSFIVNLQYVVSVDKYDIIMKERRIPISRGTKKQFMRALVDYLGGDPA